MREIQPASESHVEKTKDATILAFPSNEKAKHREVGEHTYHRSLLDSDLSDAEISDLIKNLTLPRVHAYQDDDEVARYILGTLLTRLRVLPNTSEENTSTKRTSDIPDEQLEITAHIKQLQGDAQSLWMEVQQLLQDRKLHDHGAMGDFFMDLYINARNNTGDTNLFRAMELLRQKLKTKYPIPMVYAHRTALLMLDLESVVDE